MSTDSAAPIEVIETDAQENHDPVEDAARSFTQMLPSFKNMVRATPSKGGLVRVLNALVEFPLGKTTPRLLTDHEKSLFYLFQQIVAHKGVVMNDILQKMQTERKTEDGKETN